MSKWVVCRLGQIDDYSKASEECRERFWSIKPRGKIFECLADEAQYITIKYGEDIFKCENYLFKNVPEPEFKIGDKVLIGYSKEIGIIREIYWHGSRNAPFYLLTVNNKKKSRRFFDDEIELQ